MVDFFISYAAPDRDWAVWIAWELEELGYTTAIQAWDFVPGSHFVFEMQHHASTALKTIAILSPDYLSRAFTHAEWAATFTKDPTGAERRLLPIRVRECTPDGLLRDLVWLDFVGVEHSLVRQLLIEAASSAMRIGGDRPRSKPASPPSFPAAKLDDGHTVNASRRFGFVHAAVRAGGMLDLNNTVLPYYRFDDVTAPKPSVAETTFIFSWLPHVQYLTTSALSRFTPAVCVCTPDFVRVSDAFVAGLDEHLDTINTIAPSHLRPHEKTAALRAAAAALESCFVASIAAPAVMLGGGRNRPAVAYQALSDLLLLPVLELHRRRGAMRVDIRMAPVGEGTPDVIRCAKRLAASVFTRRKEYLVSVTPDDGLGRPLISLSRLIAWAVGAYYNHGDKRWLNELELDTVA